MKARRALFILAAIGTASTIYADKVQFSQLPANVQQTIRSRAGRRPIEVIDRNLLNGVVTYEANWKDNGGAPQGLLVSEAGTVLRDVIGGPTAATTPGKQMLTLANRVGIPMQEAPPAVQAAIHNEVANAAIDGIQRGIANGRTIYEVTYHDLGQLKTFQLNEAGQPIGALVPASAWQARYSNLADQNVTLLAGSKMAFAAAPREVQTTVMQMANGARIEDFQRGTWNGRTVYGAAFKREGQNVELQVLDDGSILTKQPATAVGAPASGAAGVGQP
jgi:hypothetical protein